MKILRHFLKHHQLLHGSALQYDPPTKSFKKVGPGLLREVVDLVKEAHVFVIEVSSHAPLTTRSDVEAGKKGMLVVASGKADDKFLPLAPPFKVCWFESICENSELPITVESEPDDKDALSGAIGALMHETSPGIYDLFVFAIHARRPDGMGTIVVGEKTTLVDWTVDIEVYRSIDAYHVLTAEEATTFPDTNIIPTNPGVMAANKWLQAVNQGQLVVEETSNNVVLLPRPDRPHKRKPLEIRRIVRILPKHVRKAEVTPLTDHGIIDWSHRWEVRGHWRKVHGLGKDRAGDYVVTGWTWVRDFVKGPEDKPLIKKTRVVPQLER